MVLRLNSLKQTGQREAARRRAEEAPRVESSIYTEEHYCRERPGRQPHFEGGTWRPQCFSD